jgi:hypothetical protein
VALIALLLLLAPSAAQARTITVGSPLQGSFSVSLTFLAPSVTVSNTVLGDPTANVVSPVDGVVVRWRLVPQAAADAYALRVLHPEGGKSFVGAGTSISQVASTTAIQTFPTNLPIKAGDAIGINSLKNSPTMRAATVVGGSQIYWNPALPDGGLPLTPTSFASSIEVGFNADVQPAPRVVLVSPGSGPVGGGTTVNIAGSDFTNVSDVRFGTTPAASFVVNSESEITAVAPAAAGAGPVDVTVTTNAGTSPAASEARFTSTTPPPPTPPTPSVPQVAAATCTVPKLFGKKMKASRKALRKAGCKIGKVSGRPSKGARVVKQSRKAGAKVPAGSKVNVTLR